MNINPPKALFLIVLMGSTLVTSVYAVDASPSADTQEITESLKTRLKETINSVDEASDTSRIVGYVGKIKDVVKNTLVVEDKSGKRNIVVDDSTAIVRSPGSTPIKLESVRIGDSVIIMGSTMDNSETRGRRIIVSDTPFNPPAKISGLATITKISATSLVITPLADNQPLTLALTTKTIIKTPQGSLDSTDLQIGDQVIYTALIDAKDSTKMTATVIMRIKSITPTTTSITPSSSPVAKKVAPSPAPEN